MVLESRFMGVFRGPGDQWGLCGDER